MIVLGPARARFAAANRERNVITVLEIADEMR
jgi:hypothetical protein